MTTPADIQRLARNTALLNLQLQRGGPIALVRILLASVVDAAQTVLDEDDDNDFDVPPITAPIGSHTEALLAEHLLPPAPDFIPQTLIDEWRED